MTDQGAAMIVRVFGHPLRLMIFGELAASSRPLAVRELHEALRGRGAIGMTAHQVAVLAAAGLIEVCEVRDRRNARERLYTLSASGRSLVPRVAAIVARSRHAAEG